MPTSIQWPALIAAFAKAAADIRANAIRPPAPPMTGPGIAAALAAVQADLPILIAWANAHPGVFTGIDDILGALAKSGEPWAADDVRAAIDALPGGLVTIESWLPTAIGLLATFSAAPDAQVVTGEPRRSVGGDMPKWWLGLRFTVCDHAILIENDQFTETEIISIIECGDDFYFDVLDAFDCLLQQPEPATVPKYRNKPVVIEAFQFKPVWRAVGACADNAPVWFLQAENDGVAEVWGDDEVPYCMIKTLEGSMKASDGDWIIKGVKGEIYPCKDDIFKATYDPA